MSNYNSSPLTKDIIDDAVSSIGDRRYTDPRTGEKDWKAMAVRLYCLYSQPDSEIDMVVLEDLCAALTHKDRMVNDQLIGDSVSFLNSQSMKKLLGFQKTEILKYYLEIRFPNLEVSMLRALSETITNRGQAYGR